MSGATGIATGTELMGDVPKRFGLKYDPPAIILEYLQVSTGKLFHRQIGLRRLRATSDPARVAEKLRQKNRTLLVEDKVSFDQLVTLVSKLQLELGTGANGSTAATAAKAYSGGASASVAAAVQPPAGKKPDGPESGNIYRDTPQVEDKNLNKLSDEELAKHKADMDVLFLKNQKKPGDADYVYDVQVEFPETDQPSGWDSSDSDA
jgi:centrosomal protein CEP19